MMKKSNRYEIIIGVFVLFFLWGVILQKKIDAEIALWSLFILILFYISVMDIKYFVIPNSALLLLFLLGGEQILLLPGWDMWKGLAGILIGGGPSFLIWTFFPNKIGGGDVKLMAVGGWILGWDKILLAVLISSVIGSIVGIFMILFMHRNRTDLLPFAPFLSLGFISSYSYGSIVISLYCNLFR